MLQNYTLVIPTFNRSESLKRLLDYLKLEGADFPIKILDSSNSLERVRNRVAASESGLNCEIMEFAEDTHPFDKFQAGIDAVQTDLCALCADDDIPILKGTRESVNFLSENPDYVVAHGYYFQFALQPRLMRLTNFTYYTPSYEMDEPVVRVHALMRHYQALTYGTYRTNVLQHIFETIRPFKSILARELLSSVLATVQGRAARLPVIFHGRSLGPSASYENWHPLEWLIRTPSGLFEEYVRYREVLARELLLAEGNSYEQEDIYRFIDIIHMQYLVRHAPEGAFDIIVDGLANCASPAEVFSSKYISQELISAANRYKPWPLNGGTESDATRNARAAPFPYSRGKNRWLKVGGPVFRLLEHQMPQLANRLRRFLSRQFPMHDIPKNGGGGGEATQEGLADSLVHDTQQRQYFLAEAFLNPPLEFSISLDANDKFALLGALDNYRE